MAHDKVYAICENMCMEETMTKEQIEEAFGDSITVDGQNSVVIKGAASDEIKSLVIEGKGEQETSKQGKNLFDKNNMNTIPGTVDVESITINNVGKTFYLKCSPNTTYTISRKVVGSRFVAGTTNGVPKSGETVYDRVVNNSGQSITLTSSANSNYLCVYYLINSNENEQEILDSIQVELGSTATSYEPFTPDKPSPDYPSPIGVYENLSVKVNETAKVINLQNNFIGAIGDVKDIFKVYQGVATLTKKISKVVLTGDESWQLNGGKFFINGTSHKKFNDGGKCISTHYPYGQEMNNHIWIGNTNFIIIKDTRFATVAEFKAWLATNNVTVYYISATENNVDLGSCEINTNQGENTIEVTSNIDTDFELTYRTYVSQMEQKKQNVVLHGTTAPSNDLGVDGDIYLQHN